MKQKKQIKIIMLGGMSECGKSHAAKFLSSIGFTHLKIIQIERTLVAKQKAKGLIEKSVNENDALLRLYENDHENVFADFEQELRTYCLKNKVTNIVMDSTTRTDMVCYFQKKTNPDRKFVSLYIDRIQRKRIEGEWRKLQGAKTLKEVAKSVKAKDKTKRQRGAHKVKNVSLTIDNNGSVAEFETKLQCISKKLLNGP